MGTVTGGRMAPHESVSDDVDDAADDLSSVIDAWDAPDLIGQEGFESVKLCLGEPEVVFAQDEAFHRVRA